MAKKSTKLETLHDILKENSLSLETIELNTKLIKKMLTLFQVIDIHHIPNISLVI